MSVRLPAMPYCLDNAAMIAGLAHWRFAAGAHDDLRLAPSARSTVGHA
jgi:tRNA A37 threonylcarbamoyltransferase TsaD